MGRARDAEGYLRRAVAIDPGLKEGWYNLADVTDDQDRFTEAISCLKQCLRLDPDYADAHFNIAAIYERDGQPKGARRHWNNYLEFDHDSEWATIARIKLRLLPSR